MRSVRGASKGLRAWQTREGRIGGGAVHHVDMRGPPCPCSAGQRQPLFRSIGALGFCRWVLGQGNSNHILKYLVHHSFPSPSSLISLSYVVGSCWPECLDSWQHHLLSFCWLPWKQTNMRPASTAESPTSSYPICALVLAVTERPQVKLELTHGASQLASFCLRLS